MKGFDIKRTNELKTEICHARDRLVVQLSNVPMCDPLWVLWDRLNDAANALGKARVLMQEGQTL